MSWIRMAIAGVALLGVASVASAQAPHGGPGGHRMGRGEMGKMLFAGIELTDAQKDQIQKINEKYRAEHEALRPTERQTPGSTDDAARAKMMELQSQQSAEIRAILTADQQKAFDHNLHELKERMDRSKSGS